MSKHALSAFCGGLFLATMTTFVAAPTAHADEYQAHVERATHLNQEQSYRDALKEFQAAYALKQSPALFLAMARLQLQLGDGRDALDSYRRYQLAMPANEPSLRQETDDAIARLTALYEPRPAPAVVRSQGISMAEVDALINSRLGSGDSDRLRRRNTSLMVGGSVLFGLGYGAAFLSGSFLLGGGSCNSSGGYNYTNSGYATQNTQCSAANGILLVPFVGPFVSALIQPSVYWSIPWIFVDGAAQIGGLAMIILAARGNHALAAKTPLAQLRVLPYSNARESGITLAGRF